MYKSKALPGRYEGVQTTRTLTLPLLFFIYLFIYLKFLSWKSPEALNGIKTKLQTRVKDIQCRCSVKER